MDDRTLQNWVGRSETADDVIDARQADLMARTMDRPAGLRDGAPLPPLWHWIYFAEAAPTAELAPDGHAPLGAFMPPVDLKRRMWAGGRVTFHQPLVIGQTATRTSTVKSITPKQGRSGRMCFVTLQHTVSSAGRLCISEERDIVYLEPRNPADAAKAGPPAPQGAQFGRSVSPNSPWLFRYSALTFNGHRIHYDADFCRDVEGYPDLVVHGPLLATLLAGLAEENLPGGGLKTFAYRAVSPVFNGADFSIHGRAGADRGAAWALTSAGGLAMSAEFTNG